MGTETKLKARGQDSMKWSQESLGFSKKKKKKKERQVKSDQGGNREDNTMSSLRTETSTICFYQSLSIRSITLSE